MSRRKIASACEADVSGISGGHRVVLKLELNEDFQKNEMKGCGQSGAIATAPSLGGHMPGLPSLQGSSEQPPARGGVFAPF